MTSRRKRLLIVAPAFPPHPSPATHRARFLARYAPEHGWEPEVLSVDPAYYDEALDMELLDLVPAGLRVTRTSAFRSAWTRPLGIGDLGLRSYFPMRRALRAICAERRPDMLFIPGGPFYPFLLGAAMREEFGIPYVLDFTDPWVFRLRDDERGLTKKARWSYELARVLEPRAVRGAAHIVAVSDGTNDEIRARHPELPASRFSGIPFGFEGLDFDALRRSPRPHSYWDRGDGLLHFVYVGAMLPHGYEPLRALFSAVVRLRERAPALHDRLRLHFFGTTYDPRAEKGLVVPVAEEMGLAAAVTEHPRRIPYVDALNVLTSADGILALGSTLTHYTASKIFPCILAQRPLLALFHEASTVCDIMRATGAGELVAFSDERRAESHVTEIAEALERLCRVGAYDPARVKLAPLAAYSAEAMSRRILGIFDEITGDARPAPVMPRHRPRQAEAAIRV